MRSRLAALALALAAAPLGAQAGREAERLPPSALAVWSGGAWREWWRSAAAPARWGATDPTVAGAVAWRRASPGVEWGELRLAGTGEAWRVRVILARIDPRAGRLALHMVVDEESGLAQPWSVSAAPDDALLALNAGQFDSRGPWGWIVHEGRELRRPGVGPLAPALVVDSSGATRLVPADSIAAVRAAGGIATAFQSYPALLLGEGELVAALRAPGRGVDVGHRDARLAIAELRDGRLLVAMTRFEGLGGVLQTLPFGLTTPEMAALMGALGARRAMLLDGGISGQLRIAGAGEWPGLRRVPVGLVFAGRN